ncbi:MAG: tRNA (N6-threonylcarbamoyladenosine(37)-N6)-methyltransferase TrmO [Anaerolineae bacterium]|nr:tRNA (N6-threonylcarbamoyladenosine(37)-N6)-methyltransferase TrmO [Anaerolineae bacterium]
MQHYHHYETGSIIVSKAITLAPIGVVKSQFKSNTPPEEMRGQPAQIVITPEFEPGLMGLAAGIDILVLFYFHSIRPEEVALQLHPRHNLENPLRGVFATRSQFRPNPIGASVVGIKTIENNVITVLGLDALDGTPVLDIKPYASYFDVDLPHQQLEVRETQSIEETRQAIDLIDAEIIRLLGNRAGFVRQIVNFKKNAEEIRAPARYAEVMRRRRELAQAAGLNPDVVEGMYKLLVDNFIEEEMKILRQKEIGDLKLTGQTD